MRYVVQLSQVGIRNEFWRSRLLIGLMVPPRFARLCITERVKAHPRGLDALAELLSCPTQLEEGINPRGDCDLLMAVRGWDVFYLRVEHYRFCGTGEELVWGSEDPTDDLRTTRVFTCLMSSEY